MPRPAGGAEVWRVSTAPSRGAEVGHALAERVRKCCTMGRRFDLDFIPPAADDASARLVRATLAAAGGHATLIRAPAAVRAAVEVFEPEPAAPVALTRRLPESFDPQACSTPGGCGRVYKDADLIQPSAARRSRRRAIGKDLRACVHCGFCSATCPTYVLDGNGLNSPRGRIYFIKDMLENDRPATAEVTEHIDRCLSCLACMTTCPSGVHDMHLVDHARAHIEANLSSGRSPSALLRTILAKVDAVSAALPAWRSAAALLGKPFAAAWRGDWLETARRHAAVWRPGTVRIGRWRPGIFPAVGPERQGRVALLAGCVNDLLSPQINAAAIRVLTRLRHRSCDRPGCRLLRLAGASHGAGGRGAWRRRAPISRPGPRLGASTPS